MSTVGGTRGGGSFVRASGWMIGLSILLLWLPLLGPLIAGFVGGRVAGTLGKALVAALMPAVVLGVLVGVVFFVFELELIGILAGLGVAVVVVVEDALLFVGAAAGALVGGEPRG